MTKNKTFSKWVSNDWPHFVERLTHIEADTKAIKYVVGFQGVIIIALLGAVVGLLA